MNNRFSNYGLWVSCAAFFSMLCQTTGIITLPANYNDIVNSLLGILILLGIISNPSSGVGYVDSVKPTDTTTK